MSVIVLATPTVDNGLVRLRQRPGERPSTPGDARGTSAFRGGTDRTTAETFVEFEFHQGVAREVGASWPIHGERQENDVLVRVDFTAGQLTSARFAVGWLSVP
jgi:hypothetical protein